MSGAGIVPGIAWPPPPSWTIPATILSQGSTAPASMIRLNAVYRVGKVKQSDSQRALRSLPNKGSIVPSHIYVVQCCHMQ